MTVKFLGQGLENVSENSVGRHLELFLSQPELHSFTGISAFASSAGIYGIARLLERQRQKFQNITIIVGVDQKGTSKEALDEIASLNVNGYVFYQPVDAIFHPKIYIFEGDSQVKLIIGSTNFTMNGLYRNVECSLSAEFEKGDEQGDALFASLKAYYDHLLNLSDPNLIKITTESIAAFVADGLVPSEATRRSIYTKRTVLDSQPRSVNVPARDLPPVPTTFPRKNRSAGNRPTSSSPRTISELIGEEEPAELHDANLDPQNVSPEIEPEGLSLLELASLEHSEGVRRLLWNSGPLSQRDLNVPTGSGTHRTGSMTLKKGAMQGIDQRHYFRDVVFVDLPWASDTGPRNTHLERATAFFRIIIDGDDRGEFALGLTHNTDTESKTYLQNNAMTHLRWGTALPVVARPELIEKTAKLYSNPDDSFRFTLEIE